MFYPVSLSEPIDVGAVVFGLMLPTLMGCLGLHGVMVVHTAGDAAGAALWCCWF